MSEKEDFLNNPEAQLLILNDQAQRYVNMLRYIHDLKDLEREKITEWLCQTEEKIQSLQFYLDAKVAVHP